MGDSESHLVFISYATRDRESAEVVLRALEAVGVTCWVAHRDIPPASDWANCLTDAINASRVMLLLFSKAADESQHVQREISMAVDRKLPLIPVRIEDHEPTGPMEYNLKTVQWLDACEGGIEDHEHTVIETVLTVLADKSDLAELVLVPAPPNRLPAALLMTTGTGVGTAGEAVELLQRLIAEAERELNELDPQIKESRGPAYFECVDRMDSLGEGLQLAEKLWSDEREQVDRVRGLAEEAEQALASGALKTALHRFRKSAREAVAARVQSESVWELLRDLHVRLLDGKKGPVDAQSVAPEPELESVAAPVVAATRQRPAPMADPAPKRADTETSAPADTSSRETPADRPAASASAPEDKGSMADLVGILSSIRDLIRGSFVSKAEDTIPIAQPIAMEATIVEAPAVDEVAHASAEDESAEDDGESDWSAEPPRRRASGVLRLLSLAVIAFACWHIFQQPHISGFWMPWTSYVAREYQDAFTRAAEWAGVKLGEKHLVAVNRDAPWFNSLGMQFVPLPGTNRILVAVHETRRKDYETFAQDRAGVDDGWRNARHQSRPVGHQDHHPVVNVSRSDAKKFCEWLTTRERDAGTISSRARYRLPTRAEWGLAAGEGRMEIHACEWGTVWPPPLGAGNYADASFAEAFASKDAIAGYRDNHATTAPVGLFSVNQHGVFDLGGNVSEWCFDPQQGGDGKHWRRGGAWNDGTAASLRIQIHRAHLSASNVRRPETGFRIVLAQEPDGARRDGEPVFKRPRLSRRNHERTTAGHPWLNSLGMPLVPLPGSSVLVGAYETRRKDYEAYARVNPGVDGTWRQATWNGRPVGHEPEHPVVDVTWFEATNFCHWLTLKERARGLIPAGARYRLPSDAEWSVAVGLEEKGVDAPKDKLGKVKDVYPWGTQWPPPNGVGNFADEAASKVYRIGIRGYRDRFSSTSPAGSFLPNPAGIHDLAGNAWEWCESWLDPARRKYRVVRGGSCSSSRPGLLLSSFRGAHTPNDRRADRGFRVVLDGLAEPTRPPSQFTERLPSTGAPPLTGIDESRLDQVSKDAPWLNGLHMPFVPLPNSKDLVCLYETRRRDYEAYAAANLGVDDSWRDASFRGQPVGHGANHPVVLVSWLDATNFCHWMTVMERAAGLIPRDARYRLPTDTEWSKLVGLVSKRESSPKSKDRVFKEGYPWGRQWPPPAKAGNIADETALETVGKSLANYRDGFQTTSPVGSFNRGKYGLYDLSGNVWEWCADAYDEEDPTTRVIRGASWYNNLQEQLLSSERGHEPPTDRNVTIGFRVVLSGVSGPAD